MGKGSESENNGLEHKPASLPAEFMKPRVTKGDSQPTTIPETYIKPRVERNKGEPPKRPEEVKPRLSGESFKNPLLKEVPNPLLKKVEARLSPPDTTDKNPYVESLGQDEVDIIDTEIDETPATSTPRLYTAEELKLGKTAYEIEQEALAAQKKTVAQQQPQTPPRVRRQPAKPRGLIKRSIEGLSNFLQS